MSYSALFSRNSRNLLAAILTLGAAGCRQVVSIDPFIGAGEAVPLPRLMGDWVTYEDDGDSVWARVTPGADSTSYVVRLGQRTTTRTRSLDGPTLSLRIAPIGQHLVAELIPSDDDAMIDTISNRYGVTLQLMYLVVVVKFEGSDLQVWELDQDSVQASLRGGQCPPPGGVIEPTDRRPGALILWGDTAKLRATLICLLEMPGALNGPQLYSRIDDVASADGLQSRPRSRR
jgi:hypothetical protein